MTLFQINMNDANLLGSLTYTTKAQQPFKIAYDYTKNGTLKMSQDCNVLLQGSSNLRPASSTSRCQWSSKQLCI
ncbi:hypothetical protein MHB75_00815 [Kurthia sp. FSL E2-0154]|uniref:hypothetical protein n=2 Tax=Kurthia TaxID=1649 RepID=UPI0030FAB29A